MVHSKKKVDYFNIAYTVMPKDVMENMIIKNEKVESQVQRPRPVIMATWEVEIEEDYSLRLIPVKSW
jgi:hypothetical protein